MFSTTFLKSAPRIAYFQEPEETHLELASVDSTLALVISLLHVSTGTETVLRKCIKTIMSSANYEKEGGCFGRMLKTRARRITKCLRNYKHPLVFEQSLHLGESREVTRQLHAKGDEGGGERKGFAARSRVLSP